MISRILVTADRASCTAESTGWNGMVSSPSLSARYRRRSRRSKVHPALLAPPQNRVHIRWRIQATTTWTPSNAHWTIGPTEGIDAVSRSYRPDTLVLETEMATASPV